MSPGRGADGHAQADLAVRSVTDTSMMFMIPTPPTTSEISATHSSRPAIRPTVACTAWITSVMSRTLKSSGCAGPMRCRSRSSSVICSHRRPGSRSVDCGADEDRVDVGEPHQPRACRPPGSATASGTGPGLRAGIAPGQEVDLRRRVRVGRRRALGRRRPTTAADAVLDRRPRGQQDVVLVHRRSCWPPCGSARRRP